MKRYKTKPIDFTGCHPVIAEALKRGEWIKCKVWDDINTDKKIRYVVGYWSKTYVSKGIAEWDYAEPIARKVKRVMPPERAIPVLIAEGWRFDNRGALRGEKMDYILPQMFEKMGKPLEDNSWQWPPCIIEEVEDDE